MFHGGFQTKERKVITAILGLIIVVIGIFVFKNFTENNRFVEQAVMAENYLKAGNYEQAIEAYLEALSAKGSDAEFLSIGLADAYIGLNDYDKALEALNSYYQKTSGIKIKKKIEEVMSAKTDYEYLQSISRGEVYYSNEEYDKAIMEYEKAKLIDSKEVTAYQRIAMAYIKQVKYDLAREEVQEGQELVQSEELDETKNIVDSYLHKDQYDTMVTQAEEYIFQDNYEDGIKEYLKAINLLPTESTAYIGLAKAFIAQEDYSKAVSMLQEAKTTVNSKEMDSLLTDATKLKANKEEKNHMLSELYLAMKTEDMETVRNTMDTDFFKEQVVLDVPIYYSVDIVTMTQENALIIYDSKTLYFGGIINGVRKGNGLYFILSGSEEETGYYYYEGGWRSDLPNGAGKTVEWKTVQNNNGDIEETNIITEGYFHNAKENGTMIKYFYTNNKETGKLTYKAKNGVPLPADGEDKLQGYLQKKAAYVIGELYHNDEPTNEEYSVDANTEWGVYPFYLEEQVSQLDENTRIK